MDKKEWEVFTIFQVYLTLQEPIWPRLTDNLFESRMSIVRPPPPPPTVLCGNVPWLDA